MADLPHGLGALESPPDDRDFALDDLYTADQLAAALPASYRVPVLPKAIFDQGSTPMCVAYSAATEQAAFDLVDQGHNYRWDFGYFFRAIGGGPNGAVIRNALDRRLHRGYPLLPAGSGNSQTLHRISAYYRIPVTKDSLRRAIQAFGVIVLGTPWFNSWFYPVAGILPPADYQVGGHAICAVGWNQTGLVLRNTWGAGWGVNGECTLPWGYLGAVREAWKAIDVIDKGA